MICFTYRDKELYKIDNNSDHFGQQ